MPGTWNGSPVSVQVPAVQNCSAGASLFTASWSGGSFTEAIGGSQSDACANFDGLGRPESLNFAGNGISSGTTISGTIYGPSSSTSPSTMGFVINTPSGVLVVPQEAPGAIQGVPGRVLPFASQATALAFAQQPTDPVANQSITPAVTVQLKNASGVVNASGVPVTIAISSNPGNSTLSGTLTETTVNGVATFSDLSLNNPQSRYTLVASSPGLTGSTSSQFDVTGETECNTSMDCFLTLNGPNSTLSIDAGPNNGQLTGEVDPGTPMDGPGSNPKQNPGCANYSPQNLDWYMFDVVNQVDENGPPAKSVTLTAQDATPNGYRLCFGSTSQFVVINSDGRPAAADAGTLPDGEAGFVGFLPFCDQLSAGNVDQSSEPCITDDPLTTRQDPNSTTGQDVIVRVTIPADFPGDPAMGRG